MPLADSLGVEPMCRLAGVSRAGFYRFLQPRYPGEEEMEVRHAIQQIVVEHRRRYGYRRVTIELGRRGMRVNHKRVLRLMREDNLLGIEPKAFVATTDSDHDQQVYLNLAKRINPTAINQLWVADITYIRLRQEFVYLAVVLDAFSRKVVGWALDRTLTARLPLLALERAIAERQPAPGLVHHSDRGIQYCSEQYTGLLEIHGILPSMSRPGNPYDNAFCETFIKTLKREQICAGKYQYIDELNAHLEEFIDRYYNRQRLHSALGYRSPEEFEAAHASHASAAKPAMSFSRHEEIYRSWKRRRGRPCKQSGEPVQPGSPAHRIDESPVGYSLTGWSPPEPVSASPTADQSAPEETK
ncbi:MAG TPA: IS3 family transposase [Terracidiphilus sp.]|nr:IS3 family transposase [Terracidiphilus sp.]